MIKPGKTKLYILFFVLPAALLFIGVKLFLDAVYVPVIIMYHSVGEGTVTLDGYGGKLNVRPETFERQMRFLRDRGYNVIPLVEFIKRIKSKRKIPHRTIAITFDDGLKNNFINAYPVLRKYGLPATIFVASDFVGKDGFLTWEDMRTMQRNGISIGSHTMSHSWLASLDEKGIREELVSSKRALESGTGRTIETLSYPLGGFTEKVKEIAEEAGYLGAVSTNPGRKSPNDDIYALKRIRISMSSDNMFAFWGETSGFYTFIKEWRDDE